ncbi:MAG: tRNA (adenosine(37)-N6)-threonylcarbamoyltransferase complex ATPase subunit type 1 TsaE [bacterium]
MKHTTLTSSVHQTVQFGKQFSKKLKPGDVVALTGALGAGKTSFTQGIARGLGVKGYVRSPSFTLINEYSGKLPVFHFDLYRLENIREIESLGYGDYFFGSGVTVIEWAEKAKEILPGNYWLIKLVSTGENIRRITVRKVGK